MVLALRLAKGGWYGGNPGKILKAPAEHVMLAIQYDDFVAKYEKEMMNLNRRENE